MLSGNHLYGNSFEFFTTSINKTNTHKPFTAHGKIDVTILAQSISTILNCLNYNMLTQRDVDDCVLIYRLK